MELCGEYVKALTKDQEDMDVMYGDLQKAVVAKDIDAMRTTMELVNKFLNHHQKRFRLAQGQVKELEKIDKEQEKNKDDQQSIGGSSRKGK